VLDAGFHDSAIYAYDALTYMYGGGFFFRTQLSGLRPLRRSEIAARSNERSNRAQFFGTTLGAIPRQIPAKTLMQRAKKCQQSQLQCLSGMVNRFPVRVLGGSPLLVPKSTPYNQLTLPSVSPVTQNSGASGNNPPATRSTARRAEAGTARMAEVLSGQNTATLCYDADFYPFVGV